jgi:hypothetical protein
MSKPFNSLFEFPISLPREIDQVTTRIEGEGPAAKTISETTKVIKNVSIPVCLKRPSRVEREDADVERAVWETHYITKGILPRALLLKHYNNYGGILSEAEKKDYDAFRAEADMLTKELELLYVTERENADLIKTKTERWHVVRDWIIDFEQQRSVFFTNTAESKARQKLIEWYVLHLSYYRPVASDESLGEWTPFFAGSTTADKLVTFDQMVENQDQMLTKARSMLEFLGTIVASNDSSVTKEEIAAFAETMTETDA